MRYELYYWPEIQGRGEFVRLALEDAGADYVDVARGPEVKGQGVAALLGLRDGEGVAHPPFAPPFLRAGRLLIGQTANILLFLGARHRLAPASEGGRLWAHQLQLTIMDFVKEIHDTHHPIASSLYYEEQKAEAARRAENFRAMRAPKFLRYFERVLEQNGGKTLVGRTVTYADLSLFQVIEGLRYAFPRGMRRWQQDIPLSLMLHERVAARPRLAAYLASPRRLPFSQQDLFRHYPELDG